MEQIRPEYGGRCVANIVPALLDKAPSEWLPEPARSADRVVLFVLDGVAWAELERHRARTPVLASMEGGPITTVVPSTTSTVLPSITTGAPPARHGLVGLRMLVGDGAMHVLRWTGRDGFEPPDPKTFQPVRPFFGRAVPVVTRSSFYNTGFSTAHMRDVRFFGWFTTSTLVERVRTLVRDGESFVYAYYDGVDHVAHARGLNDSFYDVELAFADRLVGEVLDALPGDTALVVTSDHGQVDLPQGSWMQLPPELHPLIDAHGGDARFRYLYARPGAADELAAVARETLGDVAWVFSREQVIDERVLGPDAPEAHVASRIGDVVIAAHARCAFIDPAMPEEVRLRSAHGSLTRDEMLVPLLAARGRA